MPISNEECFCPADNAIYMAAGKAAAQDQNDERQLSVALTRSAEAW